MQHLVAVTTLVWYMSPVFLSAIPASVKSMKLRVFFVSTVLPHWPDNHVSGTVFSCFQFIILKPLKCGASYSVRMLSDSRVVIFLLHQI